jgi:hypothetical protein
MTRPAKPRRSELRDGVDDVGHDIEDRDADTRLQGNARSDST